MKLIQILLGVCLVASVGHADPISFKTRDGKVYDKVTLQKADSDGLTIETDSGIEKIPFQLLPAELQTKFGYDPARVAQQAQEAAAIRQKQALATIAQAQEPKSFRIHGRAIQVLDGGILVEAKPFLGTAGGQSSFGGGGNVYVPPDPNGAGRPPQIYGGFLITDHPDKAQLADNDPVDVDVLEDGVFSYIGTNGGKRTVKKYKVIKAFK